MNLVSTRSLLAVALVCAACHDSPSESRTGAGNGSPGPVYPVPDSLWRPPITPGPGNYVYLKSDSGDYVGAGQTSIYTPGSEPIAVSAAGGHLFVSVDGDQWWFGDFLTMSSLHQLEPGYYPGLPRYMTENPVNGSLDWFGEGRGCNTLTGWFAVDGVTYANGNVTAVDVRFEQHCEGAVPALRGAIHWVAP